MRVAFDGSTLCPRRTGVGYYTEHLLRHLADTLPPEDELTVISNVPIDPMPSLPSRVRVLCDTRRLPRMVWMQTRVPGMLREIRADVAHYTNGMMPLGSRVPSVVTIHDMSLRLLPNYHPARRVLLNRPLMDYAVRRADALITVSESARADIVDTYRIDPHRVHVVHEAAASLFKPVTNPAELRRVRRQYGLSERFILYVGTIEPRKNLPILIEAFAGRHRLGELDHQLVCVGPYGWLSRGVETLIARSKAPDAIAFTGYVPVEDLPALYSAAEIFVYPSMYEGFGLPVIEAMACGTPVVTGRASAVAEVGGDAVEQVSPMDPDTLGDALVALARSSARRAQLSAAGQARARAFSWSRAAHQTVNVYDEVLSHSAPGPSIAGTGQAKPVDVLFGQAYFLRFDPKLWEARQPYAPLGALYAAACVRDRGYRVALFDAMLAESEAEWVDALDRHAPRLAVIYEDNFNYLSKMCLLRMRQAALTMIAAARERGIPVVVAGSDATDHPAPYLDAGAAAVVAGEGEITLVEVVRALIGEAGETRRVERARDRLGGVNGVCYRDERGSIVRSMPRDIIRDLDALPRPAWDLVDVRRYQQLWRSRHGYFSMNVATSRGCPYHCNWCSKPIYGQRYTARSPEHVVDEIGWLKRTFQPDHVWMVDDIFGLKPGWVERFADLIALQDAIVPFKCLLRADQVTPEFAQALARAGCTSAWMGAESGSQRILDAMEKGTRVEQIASATGRLRDVGIDVGFFLQFGYPSETRHDIDLTLDMVRACRPDDIGISVSYPLPGTTFYRRVQAQLGDKQNWVDSSDLAMMYQATYVPDFYRALHALVHNEFRMRRAAADLMLVLERPSTGRPRHVRTVWQYLSRRLALPMLQRKVDRLSRVAPERPTVRPLAVLSPEAAAIPTEQPR